MKSSRRPNVHLALFYTPDCTLHTMIRVVMRDTPQFIVRECVFSLRIGVAYRRTKSVCALINIGTDVNAEGDLHVRRCLPPHSDMTYIESTLFGGIHNTTVLTLLLRAGALITFNAIKALIDPPSRTINIDSLSLFLAHINQYRSHYTCGELESAIKCSAVLHIQELLASGAVIDYT